MIKKKVLIILALISIVAQFHCLDELPFENNKIFDRINISGQLSDDNDMKFVEIRKIPSEIDLSQANGDPIEDANVLVSDNLGHVYEFDYIGKGLYESEIKGVVGRQYKLDVMIGDHKYESNFQRMLANAPIDSVRSQIGVEKLVAFNGQVTSKKVVNVVLNTRLEVDGQPIYTLYRIGGEYEFHENSVIGSLEIPKSCYVKQSFDFGKINAYSGSSLPNNQLEEHEIFRTDHDYRFLFKFSFLVSQYAVDSNTYIYWKKMEQILKEKQSLFDPPPGKIFGNIHCTSHENEEPYGYFTVASKTEKRIFTNSTKLGVSGINICSRNPIAACFNCLSFSMSSNTRPPYWQ